MSEREDKCTHIDHDVVVGHSDVPFREQVVTGRPFLMPYDDALSGLVGVGSGVGELSSWVGELSSWVRPYERAGEHETTPIRSHRCHVD